VEVRITEGYDIRAIAEGAARPGVWVGDGAAALGLTGDVDPEDFEALSGLVAAEDAEGEDQDAVDPYGSLPAEAAAAVERLRRDGLL
jgi:hypothetical protein